MAGRNAGMSDTARAVEIVAELAQGFEGRAEQARLLLKATAGAGADAAKFQLVYADDLAAPDYKHYGLFRSLEMPDETWQQLAREAANLGIDLQVDIFGRRSIELAVGIGAAAVKLHPTDLANTALLQAVADSSVSRVLLGAGGCLASELTDALRILATKPVVVILGFQGYPTPVEANQIARVRHLVDTTARMHPGIAIGFADHAAPEGALRYALAATAVGAGAVVIEKHLTLGRVMKLEDHESALNPDEFREFTDVVRACAAALGAVGGGDDFGMAEAETAYRSAIRRHVVAARPLRKGTTLGPADLALKRTSAASAVTDPRAAYSRVLARDLDTDAPLLATDLE
jgi:N,N'-diacetyllegionaminate synthase